MYYNLNLSYNEGTYAFINACVFEYEMDHTDRFRRQKNLGMLLY